MNKTLEDVKVLEKLNSTLEKMKGDEEINNTLKILKLEKVDKTTTSYFMVMILNFITFLESINEEIEKLKIEDVDKTELTINILNNLTALKKLMI